MKNRGFAVYTALAITTLFAGGCAHTPMDLAIKTEDGYAITAHTIGADAKQRYLFVTAAPGREGQNFYPMTCSEPQPDAVSTEDKTNVLTAQAAVTKAAVDLLIQAQALKTQGQTGSAKPGQAPGENAAVVVQKNGTAEPPKAGDIAPVGNNESDALANASLAYVRVAKEELSVLSQRTVSLQFLRETMFRLCEMTVNTAHMDEKDRKQYLSAFNANVDVAAKMAERLDENLALVSKLDAGNNFKEYITFKTTQENAKREQIKAKSDLAAAMKALQEQESKLAATLTETGKQQAELQSALQTDAATQEKLTAAVDKLAGRCPGNISQPVAKKSASKTAALCPGVAPGDKTPSKTIEVNP